MTLLDIRKQFIAQSGRVDLITDYSGADFSDNGADFFIRSGQKTLDSLLPTQKSSATAIAPVVAGDIYLTTDARAVKSITLSDGVEGTTFELVQLLRRVYRERYGYLNEIVTEQGRPKHFTIETVRDEATVTNSSFSQVIVIGPTPDKAYDLMIDGLYYPDELLLDADDNFWTINHPDTLVQASLYALERFHRNTQGMRDHMEAIMRDVQGIDYDVVEQEIGITDEMKDSFNERQQTRDRYYGNFSGNR